MPMKRAVTLRFLVLLALGGCGGGSSGGGGGGHLIPPEPVQNWPSSNTYSWDGSWAPSFPVHGLIDPKYDGSHRTGGESPTLPPGKWDYGNDDNLSNWGNFSSNIGTFEPLLDGDGRQYGWKLKRITSKPVNADVALGFFKGTPGADIMNLGPDGKMGSLGADDARGLGDGPDILVFNYAYAVDYRTGSTETGWSDDDDLVVAGCREKTDESFDIEATTIHTGPGSDWVFIRNLARAAVDLGNGANGRTDSVDLHDGDDLVVIRGNSYDFRIFGGAGSDTFIWYVDDNRYQTTAWLGPNFFGTGGDGSALWKANASQDASSVDRLVLAVPEDTPVVGQDGGGKGKIAVWASTGGSQEDPPTQDDPYAAYCLECGTGPGGERMLYVWYQSADGKIDSGYFGLTDIEELQVGIDPGRVYRLDKVTGTATLAVGAPPPVAPPSWPTDYCYE
jgi:hypothetical protein